MVDLSSILPLEIGFVTPLGLCGDPAVPYNPHPATATALAQNGFGLFPFRSPLLRE
jgi:hypothetical protein